MWLHSSSFLMHSTSFVEVSLARALHAVDEMALALAGTSSPAATHSGMHRAATERSDLDGRRMTPSPWVIADGRLRLPFEPPLLSCPAIYMRRSRKQGLLVRAVARPSGTCDRIVAPGATKRSHACASLSFARRAK